MFIPGVSIIFSKLFAKSRTIYRGVIAKRLEGAALSAPRLTGEWSGGGAPPSRARDWAKRSNFICLFPALLESEPYRGDEFLVVEWLHKKSERADGLGGGVRGQVFARGNNNYAGFR